MKKEKLEPIQRDISGDYRHYKGGTYRVICLARHSETLEEMVVYAPLDGVGDAWVRPARMWEETVVVDGEEHPRFERIKE